MFECRVIPTLQQDVDLMLRQSSQRAVLLLYDDEPDEVINYFNFCTNSIPTDATTVAPTIQIINVYGTGAREERILKKSLKNAITNVSARAFCIPLIKNIIILEYLAPSPRSAQQPFVLISC